METNGELRIYSVKSMYTKQWQDAVEALASDMFNQGCVEVRPDMLTFVEYFTKKTLDSLTSGTSVPDVPITFKIEPDKKDSDHFIVIMCDENGTPLKLDD